MKRGPLLALAAVLAVAGISWLALRRGAAAPHGAVGAPDDGARAPAATGAIELESSGESSARTQEGAAAPAAAAAQAELAAQVELDAGRDPLQGEPASDLPALQDLASPARASAGDFAPLDLVRKYEGRSELELRQALERFQGQLQGHREGSGKGASIDARTLQAIEREVTWLKEQLSP
jgi:hypothetical protein